MQLLRGNTVELSKLHGLPPIGRVQYEVNNV